MTKMSERLTEVFTHWIVGTEREVREMVELLWTTVGVGAWLPAEAGDGNLVLCTDQAGWDTLVEYGRISMVTPREG